MVVRFVHIFDIAKKDVYMRLKLTFVPKMDELQWDFCLVLTVTRRTCICSQWSSECPIWENDSEILHFYLYWHERRVYVLNGYVNVQNGWTVVRFLHIFAVDMMDMFMLSILKSLLNIYKLLMFARRMLWWSEHLRKYYGFYIVMGSAQTCAWLSDLHEGHGHALDITWMLRV